MEKYSVLMSVYCKETARNLETAVKSMLEQTVSPDELVLVCDGLLTDELNSVIHKLDEKSPDTLKVVRLSENIGLGRALQTGLKYASNELVARMDSDDISCPDRCEKQLLFMQKHPDCLLEITQSIQPRYRHVSQKRCSGSGRIPPHALSGGLLSMDPDAHAWM